MKKSISINISGMLFNIEEDAYERLKYYLDEIKLYFASYDASGEIVADIESRIAEIFSTKVGPHQQVITLLDVEALITQMGNIQDFAAIEEGYEEPRTTNGHTHESYAQPAGTRRLYRDENRKMIGGVAAGVAHYLRIDPLWIRALLLGFVACDIFLTLAISSSLLVIGYIIMWIALPATEVTPVEDKKAKKLYRNPDDKVIGGVAGGLGAFFGVDAVLIRILFVVGLFTGFGFLAYIILWICMPEARTLTQRMQMQGEPVTIANIEHQVKKNLNLKEGEEESLPVRILLFPFRLLSTIFSKGSAGALAILIFLGGALRVIIGLAMIVISFFALIAMLASATVLSGIYPERYTRLFEFGKIPLELINNTVPDYLIVAGMLVTAIPLLFILMMGIALLAQRWVMPRSASWGLAGVWIIAFIITSVVVPGMIIDYNTTSYYETNATFQTDSSQPIVLTMEKGNWKNLRNVDLTIVGSPDSVLRLEQRIIAHGVDHEEAQEHARWASYPVAQQGNELKFGNRLVLPKDKPYYLQHANTTLYVPYGQPFRLDYSLNKMLRGSVLSSWGYYSNDLNNNTFAFDKQGELECLTCSEARKEELQNNRQHSFTGDRGVLNYKDFDKIKVGSHYELTLTQGPDYKVEVSGNEEELDQMEVQQQGSTLSFFTESWTKSLWKNRKDKRPAQIFISVPNLAGLYLSGASRSKVELKQEKPLSLELSGAAEMQGNLEVEEIEVEMSGSSELTLTGLCRSIRAALSGASELMASKFKADKANVDLSGASNADLWVTKQLSGEISGGSDLSYRGQPSLRIDRSSGASVQQKGK